METVQVGKPYHLCFETLSNELRIHIIEQLEKKAMSVNEIADTLNSERSRISHSLGILRGCNIVDVKKHGKKMIYSLKDKTYLNAAKSGNSIFAIINEHIDNYCTCCHKMDNQAIR